MWPNVGYWRATLCHPLLNVVEHSKDHHKLMLVEAKGSEEGIGVCMDVHTAVSLNSMPVMYVIPQMCTCWHVRASCFSSCALCILCLLVYMHLGRKRCESLPEVAVEVGGKVLSAEEDEWDDKQVSYSVHLFVHVCTCSVRIYIYCVIM